MNGTRKIAWLAGLVLGVTAAAQATQYDWTGAAGTDWSNPANWSDSAGNPVATIPGAGDEARISHNNAAPNPDVGTGTYEVNWLNFRNAPSSGWTISGSGGTLTVGASGLWQSSYSANITNGVNLLIKGDQPWYVNNSSLNLYVPIGGTGIISRTTQVGGTSGSHMYYYATNSCSFHGGVVISQMNAGILWRTHIGAPESVYFGLNAAGTGPGTITLDGGLFQFLRRGTSTTGSVIPCELQNNFAVTANGGRISVMNYRISGSPTRDYPRFNFSGKLTLGGQLQWRDDGDAWGTGASYVNEGPVHRAFGSGIIVTQAVPARACIWYTRCASTRELWLPGTISDGAGSAENPLILCTEGRQIYVIGTNTYSHGTFIDTCNAAVQVAPGATLGTGDVRIGPGGTLILDAAGAIAADKQIIVRDNAANAVYLPILQLEYDGALPTLNNDAAAVLKFDSTSGADFNNYLATTGLGNLYLGAVDGDKFGGATLLPGTGNTYRFAGGYVNWGYVDTGEVYLDAPGMQGVLTGTADVQVGMQGYAGSTAIRTDDTNDFSGTLLICSGLANSYRSGSLFSGYARAGGSPFGDRDGDVVLQGGSLRLRGVAGGSPTEKRVVTYSSACGLQVRANSQPTAMYFDSLVRTNRGVMVLDGWDNVLQANEKIIVTNQTITVNNGICDPYLLVCNGNNEAQDFATYESGTPLGFGRFTGYTTGIPGSPAGTEVCDVTSATAPGNVSIYALKLEANLTGANTLTVSSGGLLVPSGTRTIDCNLDLGAAEGVATVSGATTLNGVLTGTGGLTKAGNNLFNLANTNNTFSGLITVNEGSLGFIPDKEDGTVGTLGDANNDLYVNGGILAWYKTAEANGNLRHALLPTRTVTLGPQGCNFAWSVGSGSGYHLMIQGKVTGPGGMFIPGFSWGAQVILDSPLNDYAGGTVVIGNNGGFAATSTGKLGTGPVVCLPTADGAAVYLNGNENLKSVLNTYLPVHVPAGTHVYFRCAAPVMGAATGSGDLVLGTSGTDCTLTIGLDNSNFTFYGLISQVNGQVGRVIKDGTGIMNLYGAQTYSGATTVTNGVLALMGSVAGDLRVGPNGTLTGIGHVGGSMTVDGTLALTLGSNFNGLQVDGAVTFDAGSRITVTTAPDFNPGEMTFVAITGGSITAANVDVTDGYVARVVGNQLQVFRTRGTLIMVN